MFDLNTAIRRFDIVAYAKKHGAFQIQDYEWVMTCPTCFKEKLIINSEKRNWHCWVCQDYGVIHSSSGLKRTPLKGAGGLLDLIQLLESVDRVTAIRKVLAAGYMTANELARLPEGQDLTLALIQAGIDKPVVPIPWPVGCWSISEDIFTFYRNSLLSDFLTERGITTEDLKQYDLKFCGVDRYSNRLMFPVYEGGTLVYWQARAIWKPVTGEKYIKSLNPPKMEGAAVSSDVLMNLDCAKQYSRVVITEGPIDLIHVGPHAVCSFGKALYPTQVGKLLRAGVKAIDLMWDGDAFSDAIKAAQSLASLFDVRIVQLPADKDPGDFTREQNAWFLEYQARKLSGLEAIL